jgi:hypothetical protein
LEIIDLFSVEITSCFTASETVIVLMLFKL